MAKLSNGGDENLAVEVSHADILDATIQKLERRGFEPILIVFRDNSDEIEILTRGGIRLEEFVNWLAYVWVPNSYDQTRSGSEGH